MVLDFVVIGVQKSATTWIYDCLKEHPGITLKSHKREKVYFGNKEFQDKGEGWFEEHFPSSASGKVGDVSVEYMNDPTCAQQLYRHNPNIKIIASLRNPIDRAISAYHWYVRKNLLPNKELNEGIENAVKVVREESLKDEVAKNYADLLLRGKYEVYLNNFFESFDPSQIKILLFEEIDQDPISAIKGIFNFLDVDEDFLPSNIGANTKKNVYSNLITTIERRFSKLPLTRKITNALAQSLINESKKPSLSGDNLSFMRSYYSSSVLNIERLMSNLPDGNKPNMNLKKAWDS